ncbi:DEAD/DEAH box helicase family protein [Tropicimonas aquimaris]|uniref:DEAD/DEAH box helicase family protein n=1 Tax=Tropicimonas aquimaris TaxID=914152 RepID=A0ABW3IK99_9RHOB
MKGTNGKVCPVCDGRWRGGIAAPHHVADWSLLGAADQQAMLAELGRQLHAGASFTVDEIGGHLVFRIAARDGRIAPRLVTGGQDPLFAHLVGHIDRSDHIDLAVAFALESGIALLQPYLSDLLERGGRLRLVVGDYLDVTEPAALRRLCDLTGAAQIHVYQTAGGSFHPKAWLFRAQDGGAAIVGSSNLSRTALTDGVEWNLTVAGDGAWQPVRDAFEALLRDLQVKPLTPEWIDGYAARRRSMPLPRAARRIVEDEPPLDRPEPHEIQREALAALARSRAQGQSAGLVVLATGLGKTWLSAFDSEGFARVLFVAHREEILTQAMATFRRIRPEARFGTYSGKDKEDGEVVFASIQTLAKAQHLRRFDPEAFDYIVVDEFHHAAAGTYRRLIDHFRPRYLLGLTATPDRTDGADLLALCGDNLVFRSDLQEGIARGFLAPFRYFGLPDEIDYAQIPWRSSRFDEAALTEALATRARAQNALEQFRAHGNGPAIGFCVSRRHAEFMAGFFKAAGLRALAVHSGEGSAPRTSSLEALGRHEIDILFAVDMFNEGVDVPNIGTVLMLRPTESAILFLQQLGRGLRRSGDKVLRVIDYIGNHRVFLTKARALLAAGDGDRSLSQRLDAVADGTLDLPPGCEITYDLKAIDMLREMLRTTDAQDEAEAWYRVHVLRQGRRPSATEFARAGFDPGRTGHGGVGRFSTRHGRRPARCGPAARRPVEAARAQPLRGARASRPRGGAGHGGRVAGIQTWCSGRRTACTVGAPCGLDR